jgi:hypothetical protein
MQQAWLTVVELQGSQDLDSSGLMAVDRLALQEMEEARRKALLGAQLQSVDESRAESWNQSGGEA